MKRRYNYIYSLLVKDKHDVLGLIGYGMYKRDKISYIKKFKEKHSVEPTEDDLEHFHEISEISLDAYRLRAMEITRVFLEETLASKEEARTREFEETIKGLEEEYKKKLECAKAKLWQNWVPSLLQGFVGSVLFALFVGAIVFVILGAKIGFWNAIAWISKPISIAVGP